MGSAQGITLRAQWGSLATLVDQLVENHKDDTADLGSSDSASALRNSTDAAERRGKALEEKIKILEKLFNEKCKKCDHDHVHPDPSPTPPPELTWPAPTLPPLSPNARHLEATSSSSSSNIERELSSSDQRTGCCKANTAECLACRMGLTVDEFCQVYPLTLGCESGKPDPLPDHCFAHESGRTDLSKDYGPCLLPGPPELCIPGEHDAWGPFPGSPPNYPYFLSNKQPEVCDGHKDCGAYPVDESGGNACGYRGDNEKPLYCPGDKPYCVSHHWSGCIGPYCSGHCAAAHPTPGPWLNEFDYYRIPDECIGSVDCDDYAVDTNADGSSPICGVFGDSTYYCGPDVTGAPRVCVAFPDAMQASLCGGLDPCTPGHCERPDSLGADETIIPFVVPPQCYQDICTSNSGTIDDERNCMSTPIDQCNSSSTPNSRALQTGGCTRKKIKVTITILWVIKITIEVEWRKRQLHVTGAQCGTCADLRKTIDDLHRASRRNATLINGWQKRLLDEQDADTKDLREADGILLNAVAESLRARVKDALTEVKEACPVEEDRPEDIPVCRARDNSLCNNWYDGCASCQCAWGADGNPIAINCHQNFPCDVPGGHPSGHPYCTDDCPNTGDAQSHACKSNMTVEDWCRTIGTALNINGCPPPSGVPSP